VIVAGVDIGNTTTELALARLTPGAPPEWLATLRRPTTGPKGSERCADGVADLVERAGRRGGGRPELLLMAELHPAATALVELGPVEDVGLGRAAIARPAASTPAGGGVAAGRLRRLDELGGPPAGDAIAVVLDEDFEAAAAALRDARARGWRIAGAVVRGDDAVLIANRFDRSIPIVDEVDDAAALPSGAPAAIEVAPAGEGVCDLADPLRIAVLLRLTPDEARTARAAARALAGVRAAIVVRGDALAERRTGAESSVRLRGPDGREWPLDGRAAPPLVGAIVGVRGAAGDHDGLLDAFWTPLPAPERDAGFARRLARRRPLGIALLGAGAPTDLARVLAELAPGGARVVARESRAAVLGASTTPGAGRTPFVVDVGGGTVDLHRESAAGEQAVAAAGAGELVTRMCAGLLGCDTALAERAKRLRSARVETPFVLHHEDGSRSFLGEPAPPGTVARLCALDGRAALPLPAPLAPEVWRELRRRAKRDVVARNVRRALDAAGGVPRGELVTLVGGCAADPEIVDAVAVELEPLDVAVARGDVLGRHGPRAAVAVGLVLAHAAAARP
jgi:hypothetical protein